MKKKTKISRTKTKTAMMTRTRRQSGNSTVDAHQGVILGSDEVGYGCWAGPLVVCAVAGPLGWDDPRVKDSKQLSESQLETLYEEFFPDERFVISLSIVEPQGIDNMGVYHALLYAHREAVESTYSRLVCDPPLVVIDGDLPVHNIGLTCPVVALPKADILVPECALASIIAKVTRDRMMLELDQRFPGYGFSQHVGYGTPQHQEALDKLGPCDIHRTSYKPVRDAIQRRDLQEQYNSQDLWLYFEED